MRKLYRFTAYLGRMGDLHGLFTAEDTDVKDLLGKTVYFGEVLGKHSDIFFEMEEKHFRELTDDQSFIEKFEEFDLSTGINPFNFIEEDEDEDEDDEEESD